MKRFKLKQSLKKEKNIQIQKANIKIYAKDNVFDNIDITDLIKKDLLIPKTDLQHFIYKKDVNNSNISSSSTNDVSQLDKDQDEIISEINNNNRFNIEIEKLVLIYKNGYEVPFINQYTPVKLIGQGHFGLVLSVIDNQTNQKMAVKIIQKKNFADDYYLTETQLLNKLNHERIIKLYDVVDTEDYLFIFTELCLGGSLKDYIISKYNSNLNYFMKDSECSIIIKNIMQGVEYLTNNGVIHRYLKPENIMFRKENDINSLVLCDFGLAQENPGNSFLETKCGTLIFMAPEVIMNRPYDSLVDIWSIGIIMYILESGGSHPFYYSSINSKIYIDLIKNKSKINFPEFFPIIARNFFLKLCKYEPFFRYNITRALNHPWIERINRKIPLTVIEDVERENKIKNFKSMLTSFICLRQLKMFFRRNNKIKTCRTIKTKCSLLYKYKLMSPLLNLDKQIFNLNNMKDNIKQKEEISKEGTTKLPPIFNSLSPRASRNKLFSARYLKSINIAKPEIKPRNLFNKGEKNNNINKFRLHLDKLKQKNFTYRKKNSSVKNFSFNSDLNLNLEQNSFNKFDASFDKNKKYLKEKIKKYRLYSSIRINPNRNFLKKISFFSPRIADAVYDNNEK